ncbi:hypothetical protein DRW41_10280 [Neobacillus piezotolerans]|uniref:Uncharacterized protein n=1 Tax=Neobacillus piezotolerans TaxID=2259171 RepID=A0A3D8GRF0_9BACI|nr:hypothetical protein DRW41_10280 [Neobacillus piezotolerans]
METPQALAPRKLLTAPAPKNIRSCFLQLVEKPLMFFEKFYSWCKFYAVALTPRGKRVQGAEINHNVPEEYTIF